jgi:hypothetical protein
MKRFMGVLAASLLIGIGSAHAVIVDDFSDVMVPTTQLLSCNGVCSVTNLNTGLSTTHVLAGNRRIGLDVGLPVGSTALNVTELVDTAVASGEYSISSPSGYENVIGSLWYDFGPGGANLIPKNEQYLAFDVTNIDLNLDVTITAIDTGGDTAVDFFQKTPASLLPLPSTFYHPLSCFLANTAPCGAPDGADAVNLALNLDSLRELHILITSTANQAAPTLDFAATCISTEVGQTTNCTPHVSDVPEPGTIILLSSGLLGLSMTGYIRRRRQS